MPLVISILCCVQIIGGVSLIIVAIYSYRTLQYSVDQINRIAQRLAFKMNAGFMNDPEKRKNLSVKEVEKLNNYLQHLGDNVKLQITMSFLSLYFIGASIISRPVIPLFSTFIFAGINITCGLMLIYGGEIGWYLGVCACVYALLRNLHALALIPKLAQTISNKIFNVQQFYIKYSFRSIILILLIWYFFDKDIRVYFAIQDSSGMDMLIGIEIAAVCLIMLDYFCYKMEEILQYK